MTVSSIDSPCVRMCRMRFGLSELVADNWCLGCGRSLAEIAQWSQMCDAQKLVVIAQLSERMHQMSHLS